MYSKTLSRQQKTKTENSSICSGTMFTYISAWSAKLCDTPTQTRKKQITQKICHVYMYTFKYSECSLYKPNRFATTSSHQKMDHVEKVKEGMTEIVTMKREFSVFCLKLWWWIGWEGGVWAGCSFRSPKWQTSAQMDRLHPINIAPPSAAQFLVETLNSFQTPCVLCTFSHTHPINITP